MKPIVKAQRPTQSQSQPQYINGRQVKSIQKWAYVYFVQFMSGRPSFVRFKDLDENNQQNESEVEVIKEFLQTQLPGYNVEYVVEEYGIKFGATSRAEFPKCLVFKLKTNDVTNVANVIKENKFAATSIYEKFVLKFKVFSI